MQSSVKRPGMHIDRWNIEQYPLALHFYWAGVIGCDPNGYILRDHREQAHIKLPLSPYKFSFRHLEDDDPIIGHTAQIMRYYCEHSDGYPFDAYVDVPHGVTRIVKAMCRLTGIPFKKPEDLRPDESYALLEDTINKGETVLRRADELQRLGLKPPKRVFAVFEREEGGLELLRHHGYEVTVAYRRRCIFDFLLSQRLITESFHNEVKEYPAKILIYQRPYGS